VNTQREGEDFLFRYSPSINQSIEELATLFHAPVNQQAAVSHPRDQVTPGIMESGFFFVLENTTGISEYQKIPAWAFDVA
jgi:hypothetical protein